MNFQTEVKKALEQIKPVLQADGGDISLIKADSKTGIVKVKLQGACASCPLAQITLKERIEKYLKEKIKGVKEVINV